jgi:hypothetical protein
VQTSATQYVNFGFIRIIADFGEKVRLEKQAVIRTPLVKSAALHCPLAFLSRFTKPGHEPLSVVLSSELSDVFKVRENKKVLWTFSQSQQTVVC